MEQNISLGTTGKEITSISVWGEKSQRISLFPDASKGKFITRQQSTFEMQLHSTNTLPFSTQRDNPVLTRKKGDREKAHTIENPPERVKEEGRGGAGGQEGGEMRGSWQMPTISFT